MTTDTDGRGPSRERVRELEEALARETEARQRAESLLRVQYRIADAMKAVAEPRDALSRILDALMEVDGIDCGGIYVTDEGGGLRLRAHRGLTDAFLGATTSYPADSPNVRLAQQGVPRYARYEDLAQPGTAARLAGEGIRGIAVIPLKHEGRLLAVLNLASHTFDEIPADVRAILESVGSEAAEVVALMNAEHELRERERDLDALFDAADDFLFVLDSQGRIVRTNRVVEQRLGYGAEELLGASVLAVHPEERRDEAARIVKAMLEGTSTVCPVPLRTKRGDLIPVETRVKPTRWKGEPAIVGISRDVSERERAELELRTERDFARTVMDAVGQGLTVTDADGRFEYVNPAYACMMGLRPDELVGRSPAEFTVPEDVHQLQEARAARRAGRITSYETRLRRPGGAVVPALITGAPRWRAGEVVGAISAVTDLTQRQQEEETRLQLERQVQESQRRASLGLMAAGVAHHFNNLLTVVLGNLDLAMSDPHDPSVLTMLLEAHRAGNRAANISRAMLTYVGQRVRRDERLSLSDSVRRILQPALAGLPPDIDVHVDMPATGPTVALEFVELEQVVVNLLNNAVEAIGARKGSVRVSVRVLDGDGPAGLRLERPAGVACLEFSDSGHGMDRDTRARMFDPFFTTRMTGRGLGLAVTLGIVQARDGTISVDSTPGHGTTVEVRLPVIAAEVQPA
jgi:PAS domain S-box-containing protein